MQLISIHLCRFGEVTQLITQSLAQLSTDYLVLFHSLVIFPDNVSIPLKVSNLHFAIYFQLLQS